MSTTELLLQLIEIDFVSQSEIIRKGFSQVDLAHHERKITECYDILDKIFAESKFVAHSEVRFFW